MAFLCKIREVGTNGKENPGNYRKGRNILWCIFAGCSWLCSRWGYTRRSFAAASRKLYRIIWSFCVRKIYLCRSRKTQLNMWNCHFQLEVMKKSEKAQPDFFINSFCAFSPSIMFTLLSAKPVCWICSIVRCCLIKPKSLPKRMRSEPTRLATALKMSGL